MHIDLDERQIMQISILVEHDIEIIWVGRKHAVRHNYGIEGEKEKYFLL